MSKQLRFLGGGRVVKNTTTPLRACSCTACAGSRVIPASQSTTLQIVKQMAIEEHRNASQPAKGPLGGQRPPAPSGPAPAPAPERHPGYAPDPPSMADRIKQSR